MHTAALSAPRKELIESVGIDQARRILTCMGYASAPATPSSPRKSARAQRAGHLSPAPSCTCSKAA